MIIQKNKYVVNIDSQYQLGGNHTVIIQSMTDTNTSDIQNTVKQIIDLVNAGSEMVRITVDSMQAAKAVPLIKDQLLQQNLNIPLIGCFHYNGHELLSEVSECAQALSKYRINPGNVGFGKKRDINFEKIISIAIRHNKPIRIGANWGSMDQNILQTIMDNAAKNNLSNDDVIVNTMINSVLESAKHAENIGLMSNMIVLSAKVSRIELLKRIYVELNNLCNYPLHLGLTEAGMGMQGIVSTVVALTSILQLGIGDTIRASITPLPNESRVAEVLVCKEVLQSLGIRKFTPTVTSCPGCGRTKSDFFRILTLEINEFMNNLVLKYSQAIHLKIAVMGCIVNGPGESKHADIGISLPGNGEKQAAVVFINGIKRYTLRENITENCKNIIHEYVKKHYSNGAHGQT